LDYSLSWFIAAFYHANALEGQVCFKGGTCLRKCYFSDYRFSEDLDFTATIALGPEKLLDWVERAVRWAENADGPDYRAAPPRLETVSDEYGDETYQIRVYYRGPLRWSGAPRAIRVDVTRDERVVLPCTARCIIHPYSDEEALGRTSVECYTLVEILAEKIRAVGAQRRFAISRDLYDVHQLVRSGVEVDDVIPLLPAKFEARGVDVTTLEIPSLLDRRSEFKADWDRRLSYLVRAPEGNRFDDVWETVVDVLRQVDVHFAQ
jgi:predicted nucleotidyltransferase component of viral defense system